MKKGIFLVLILFFVACGGGASAEPQIINIGSLGSEMKYDLNEFTVKAGAPVKIILKNNTPLEYQGDMKHNIVIFNDESAAMQIIKLAEGNGGNPYPDGRILAFSSLIDKQEETVLEFIAPKKPGEYLYVCTFIAHAMSMRGYMIVE